MTPAAPEVTAWFMHVVIVDGFRLPSHTCMSTPAAFAAACAPAVTAAKYGMSIPRGMNQTALPLSDASSLSAGPGAVTAAGTAPYLASCALAKATPLAAALVAEPDAPDPPEEELLPHAAASRATAARQTVTVTGLLLHDFIFAPLAL